MVTRRKAAEAKRIVLLAVLPVIRIASEIMTNMQNHVINIHQKMEENDSFLHASLSHCFFLSGVHDCEKNMCSKSHICYCCMCKKDKTCFFKITSCASVSCKRRCIIALSHGQRMNATYRPSIFTCTLNIYFQSSPYPVSIPEEWPSQRGVS